MRNNAGNYVLNNRCRMSNERAKKLFFFMKQGSKYMDLEPDIRKILPFREDIFADRLNRSNKESELTSTQAFFSHTNDYRLGLDIEAYIAQIFISNKLYEIELNPYVLLGSYISYKIHSVYEMNETKKKLIDKKKRYNLGIKYGLGVELPINEYTNIDIKLSRSNAKGVATSALEVGVSVSY